MGANNVAKASHKKTTKRTNKMYLHRYVQLFSSLLPLGGAAIPRSYTIDIHSHIIPDFYREAMINSGYELRNGSVLWADGTPIPEWTIQEHLSSMDANRIDYSVVSISAPGVAFLHGNPIAVDLSRRVNDYMHNLTRLHPKRLGAFCLLPLPNVEAALEEIDYCIDKLNFAGVGLFTNHDGHYLGDAHLDPILERLHERNIPAFVHPTVPKCWHSVSHGIVPPMLEFPFDTTRAIVNLFFSGARKRFSNFTMVFCHGGGVLPYLADRVATLSAIPRFGGFDRKEAEEQFRSYHFDLASATSVSQLAALKEFVGVEKLLVGTDCKFLHFYTLPSLS